MLVSTNQSINKAARPDQQLSPGQQIKLQSQFHGRQQSWPAPPSRFSRICNCPALACWLTKPRRREHLSPQGADTAAFIFPTPRPAPMRCSRYAFQRLLLRPRRVRTATGWQAVPRSNPRSANQIPRTHSNPYSITRLLHPPRGAPISLQYSYLRSDRSAGSRSITCIICSDLFFVCARISTDCYCAHRTIMRWLTSISSLGRPGRGLQKEVQGGNAGGIVDVLVSPSPETHCVSHLKSFRTETAGNVVQSPHILENEKRLQLYSAPVV